MRKNLWLLIVAVLTLGFAACSNDDNDDKTNAEKIAGTYTGTIKVTQEDGSQLGDPMANQKIYMMATGDNTVTLELKDFQFGSIPVGDLKVPGVTVKDNGDVAGSATGVPIMGGMISADLTVTGKVKDNKADLLIDVNAPLAPGTDPIVMHVTFVGSK